MPYNVGQVYTKHLPNLHRVFTAADVGDFNVDVLGNVLTFPSDERTVFSLRDIPLGLSCMIPFESSIPHGVPHSKLRDKSCYILSCSLGEDFGFVYTHVMEIRLFTSRKEYTVQKAWHFNTFRRRNDARQLKPNDVVKLIQTSEYWNVCSIVGGADEFTTYDAWCSDDEDDIDDYRIRMLHQLGRYFYPKASGVAQLHLNDMMTYIALNKPTWTDIFSNTPRTLKWYYTLMSQEQPSSSTMLTVLGSTQADFESELGLPAYETLIKDDSSGKL